MREDGHHGGHQRAARTQGRAHAAGHHARLPRRAAHRLPGAAAAVRPPYRAARTALRACGRGRRARRCGRHGGAAAGRGSAAPRSAGRLRQRPAGLRHRLHAWLAPQRPRGRSRRAGARHRLHAGEHVAPGQPADEVRLARRHHRGRCLSDADPAPLRRAGGCADAGRAAVLHAEQRRADRGAPLPGQGRHPVRPGRRHRRHGAHRAGGGARQADRLRHGRHQHRRQPLRRRVRARLRDAGGGRAHARADDEHPHRRRWRWLDPGFRRRAVARRPAKRRRQSRAGQLPPRRTTGADRRQCAAGPHPAAAFPAGVRRPRRPADRWRGRAREVRATGRAGAAGHGPADQCRVAGRRLPAHRRAGDGQCHQAHLGGARPRRHRLHAAVLRRGRWPACLRRGRCAGDVAHLHPSAGGGAVGLRHGPGRPGRHARGLGRACARCRGPGGRRRDAARAG